jgi:uncharacterized membrane protein
LTVSNAELTVCCSYLFLSGILVGLGVPLFFALVPPNRYYGFRTQRTLGDLNAWYPANIATGLWSVMTGIATAVISTGTFLAGIPLPLAPLVNLVPIAVGIVATLVHGTLASRRP